MKSSGGLAVVLSAEFWNITCLATKVTGYSFSFSGLLTAKSVVGRCTRFVSYIMILFGLQGKIFVSFLSLV